MQPAALLRGTKIITQHIHTRLTKRSTARRFHKNPPKKPGAMDGSPGFFILQYYFKSLSTLY